MDIEKIEQYVEDLLTVSGFCKEGEEHHLWVLLRHLYAAIAMYEQMSEDEKTIIKATQKKLKYFFETKCDLKEKKKKGLEKENNSPTPPIKEKETPKKEAEKTLPPVKRVDADALNSKREAFRQECLQYVGMYESARVADFYNYWSEETRTTGKMRFESQRFWNIERRLARWMNKSYSSADTAAAIRLRKAKKKQAEEMNAAEQQQTVTAIREQDNERREREQEESKQNQELTDDYLKRNPNGLLARWAREKRPSPTLPVEGGRKVRGER